jgi:hypothetical protein
MRRASTPPNAPSRVRHGNMTTDDSAPARQLDFGTMEPLQQQLAAVVIGDERNPVTEEQVDRYLLALCGTMTLNFRLDDFCSYLMQSGQSVPDRMRNAAYLIDFQAYFHALSISNRPEFAVSVADLFGDSVRLDLFRPLVDHVTSAARYLHIERFVRRKLLDPSTPAEHRAIFLGQRQRQLQQQRDQWEQQWQQQQQQQQ